MAQQEYRRSSHSSEVSTKFLDWSALVGAADLNPLATHLTIISEPLLGRIPTLEQYATCLAITVLAAAVALPFFARFRERIVYWL